MGTSSTTGFYTYSKVTKAVCKVTFNSTTASGNPMVVGILLSGQATLNNPNYPELVELGAKYTTVQSDNPSKTVTVVADVSKFLGLGRDTSPLQAAYNALPGRQLYFHVFLQDLNVNDTINGAQAVIDINYSCVLTDPKQQQGS